MIYISGRGIQVLGAGTIINPIIKIVTTVAILAAIGIFIVRPILDTTEEISNSVNESIRTTQPGVNESISSAQIDAARAQIASRITALTSTWPEAAHELRDCARKAGRDGIALEHCQSLGSRLTGMLSDYNFASSYADTLSAQGNTAAANRIEECVDKAGFEAGPMSRCRELADELLFG